MSAIGAIIIGLLAFCIARACGVPAWTTWKAGDATNIGMLSGLAFVYLCRAFGA